MANRIILLFILLFCLLVTITEGRFGGSRSSSRSRSRSSSGSGSWSWGSHSHVATIGFHTSDISKHTSNSGGYSYPISSSGLSGNNIYKPGTSSGKFSSTKFGGELENKPPFSHNQQPMLRTSGADHQYPPTSGLSGADKNKPALLQDGSHFSHNYPESLTSLSGDNNYKPLSYLIPSKSSDGYHLSSTGLSGSNNKVNQLNSYSYKPSIPNEPSVLRVHLNKDTTSLKPTLNHNYPVSSSGMSGSKTNITHAGQEYPTLLPRVSSGNITSMSSNHPSTSVRNNSLASSEILGSGPYKKLNSTISTKFSTGYIYPMTLPTLSNINHNNSPPLSKPGYFNVYPTTPSSGSMYSYTASPTKLSGSGHTHTSGSFHNYPLSVTGLSGSGSNQAPVVFNSGSRNSYSTVNRNVDMGIHNHVRYGGTRYGKTNNKPYYSTSSYYTSPQYVYISEYRNSGSQYSDLITGLAMYNLGRTHSHYYDHYYYDDYYRRRYESSNSYTSNNRPQDSAICTLKVKEDNNMVKALRIPCEIVSTFTKDAISIEMKPESYTNQTVCVTNSTTINVNVVGNITDNNITTCTYTVNITDPLTMKGPPVSSSKMECAVGIQTKDSYLQNNVDCNVLLKYAKMPEPKKGESIIMPSREKLKSWLAKPPWWMSLFISV
ncbi:uncharacterized protein LOC131850789 [Achroia grisella]|uniref:uncharacterized protein LOC131850789 n=1 Tax=Achroia grisella TaxID=688607 RepID=UPI0027D22280|nr:uncharacterized protein LOC131850789 [Achroia grisella]